MALLEKIFTRCCFAIALLWSLIFAGVGLPFMMSSEKAAHWVHRTWGKVFLKLMGIQVETENFDSLDSTVLSNKAKIYAANHASMFDIVVMSSLPIDFKWISKKEVKKLPLFGWAGVALGNFYINRDGKQRDLNIMKDVEDGIRRGKSIAIFPEGTRSKTGELQKFKKGAFRLSQNCEAPIIPIGLKGTFSIAPPRRVPEKWGHKVQVKVGQPITVSSEDNLESVMVDFKNKLESLLA